MRSLALRLRNLEKAMAGRPTPEQARQQRIEAAFLRRLWTCPDERLRRIGQDVAIFLCNHPPPADDPRQFAEDLAAADFVRWQRLTPEEILAYLEVQARWWEEAEREVCGAGRR